MRRVYRWLLRLAVPSLEEAEALEAEETFRLLAREARGLGHGSYMAFLGRELRSLLSTGARVRMAGHGDTGKSGGHRPDGDGRSLAFDRLAQDVRYAVRTLSHAPGFLVVTLASLTAAIAVSTAVFSVVNAAAFRPLPHVREPDRLVHVYTTSPRYQRGPNSFPDFLDYRSMAGTLEDMAAVGRARFAVGRVSEGTRQIPGLQVSSNFFQVLGVSPVLGRAFLPEDVDAGRRVVVIGYNTWQRDFHGAPDVLGRSLFLNGRSHTIVGVAPRGMVSLTDPQLVEIVVPLTDFRDARGRLSLEVVGRLRPEAQLAGVQAELDVIASQLAEAHPRLWAPEGVSSRGLRVLTNRAARLPEGTPRAVIAFALTAFVGLILLIACSNVANLLLIRGLRRRREVAIRSALGASARRVLGQLLVEHLLLFATAGGLGLVTTRWLAGLVRSGWIPLPPPGVDISVDGRVALFTLAITTATGLTFGLFPALHASRPDVIPALRGRTSAPRFRRLGVRNLLVGAQVGGSLVMVLATLLFLRSLSHSRTMDLGFDPSGVATLSLDISHAGYAEEDGRRLLEDLVQRTAGLPGVEGAGLASWVPLSGGSTVWGGLEPEGYEPAPQEYLQATFAAVTPGYVDLSGMRLLRGRDLGPADDVGSGNVALVNQAFVDRFWPGQDAVGRRIGMGDGGEVEVVGVVADVPYRDLATEIGPHIWRPLAQAYQPDVVLHARALEDPRALFAPMRGLLAEMDPDVPVIGADLMEDLTAAATAPHRLLSTTLGTAGALALLLSMLGIYGVVPGRGATTRRRNGPAGGPAALHGGYPPRAASGGRRIPPHVGGAHRDQPARPRGLRHRGHPDGGGGHGGLPRAGLTGGARPSHGYAAHGVRGHADRPCGAAGP